MSYRALQEHETRERDLVDSFQKILVNMPGLKPGEILQSLTQCLTTFKKEAERCKRTGGFKRKVKVFIKFQIETIVHFSIVTLHASDCLAGVSLEELGFCKKIVSEMKESKVDSYLESHYFTEDLSDQHLAILMEMKSLDQDVSICTFVGISFLFCQFHTYKNRYIYINTKVLLLLFKNVYYFLISLNMK